MIRIKLLPEVKFNQYTIFFLNVVLLFLLSIFAFERFSGRLFNGLDGPAFISASAMQQTVYGKTLHLNSDLLEGLSSTINDFNVTLKPNIYQNASVIPYSQQLFYALYAVELFIAVLLIGWNYRFNQRTTYLAAWCLTIFLLPYFQNLRIYSLTEATPCFLDFIFVFALMDVGIQRMGTVNWRNTLKYGAVFFCGILYGLIFAPTVFSIIAPALVFTTMHAFLKATTMERYRKLIICISIFLIAILLGWIQYILGLMLNSAASLFYSQMTGFYHSPIYISIFFLGQIPGSILGPYLFCSATLGMLLAVYQSNTLRSIALATLTFQISIVIIGLVVMSMSSPWLGPSFIYFEMIIFPFYALFAVYLYEFILRQIGKLFSIYLAIPNPFYYFAFFLVVALILLSQHANDNRGMSYPLLPASTSFTKILEKEIAITPNKMFAGRVANILPNTDWLSQCSYFLKVNLATGNDHQSSGLWFKNIPTLHEYHQEISPGFYSLYHRFLANSNEPVYRNWTNFSKINLKILRLLGVRFIITTQSHLKNTKLHATLRFDNHIAPLYLYEIANANTAGISATRVITAKSISDTEDMMATNNFKLNDAIVLSDLGIRNDELTKANHSELILEKNGIHLQAESSGKTLLILPLEFSHCLKAIPLHGVRPNILRVDGALAGILFDNKLDVMLENHIGPFNDPRCKLKDYREFKYSWKV